MADAKQVPTIGYNQVSFAIERGKQARRKSWEPGVKIYGQAPVIYCGPNPWHPTKDDMRATDWVIE